MTGEGEVIHDSPAPDEEPLESELALDPSLDPDEVEQDEGAELDPVSALRVERDEYLDSLRRLQAEFDNYRKRMTRQQTELLERSTESLVGRLLPVLDAIDLALAHAAAEADAQIFGQIASLLRDVLSREGLTRIDDVGVAFDPTIHDAVAHESASAEEQSEQDTPKSTVSEVLRAGYELKGKVLRPAMVKVES